MMDTLSTMLTTIRNGLAVNKVRVVIPYSNLAFQSLKLLTQLGYFSKVEKKVKDKKSNLHLKLKYIDGKPSVREITQISKPGRRVYQKSQDIKPYKPYAGKGRGIGIYVISTSKGLMTGRQAQMKNLGGEVLFKLY